MGGGRETWFSHTLTNNIFIPLHQMQKYSNIHFHYVTAFIYKYIFTGINKIMVISIALCEKQIQPVFCINIVPVYLKSHVSHFLVSVFPNIEFMI
jgi:hypothetical protein